MQNYPTARLLKGSLSDFALPEGNDYAAPDFVNKRYY